MPKVVFVEHSGRRREIDAPAGITLMEAARQGEVAGIVARCGGACACASCHVYVPAAWTAALDPCEEMEDAMLELAWERRVNSRLSCQITLTAGLEGLEVVVPDRQA